MSATNTVFIQTDGTIVEVAITGVLNPVNVVSDIQEVLIGTTVTAIGGGAFRYSQNLQSVTFSKGSTCTTIGSNAFQNNVTSLSLPSSLEQIGSEAFSGCQFTSLSIPDSVTTIGGSAFQFCDKMTSLTLPANFNFTSIGNGTFFGCSALESIKIPDMVTSIGNDAFNGCSALQSVTLPANVNFTSIGDSAFDQCSALTTLTVNSDIVSSNFMKNNFPDSINSLQTLVLGDNVTTVGGAGDGQNDSAFGYPNPNYATLESVTIGENITTINPNAFVNCSKLATITFPTNSDGTFNSVLQTIGVQGFAYCNLTKLTLPPSVTTLENGAFFDCDKLTEVSLHKNVTSLGGTSTGAFASSGLKILNLTKDNGLGPLSAGVQTVGGEPGVTVKIVSDFKGSGSVITNGSVIAVNQGEINKIHTFFDNLGEMPPVHEIFPCAPLPRFAKWNFNEAGADAGVGKLILNPLNADVGDHNVCIRHRHIPTGLIDEINYIIRIVNINDPPVFMSAPVRTARQESLYSYTVRTNDIDVGDLVTVTATTKPSWLSFDGTTLSGTPSRSVWGEYRVELLATDVLGATATQSFTIMVRKPVCFNEGTKILCLKDGKEQYVAVEQLREGDEVKTMKHGYKKIADMRKGSFKLNGLMDMGMYKMKKQGNMIADLEMSGLHSVLVDANDAKYADDIKRQRGLNNKKFYIDGKFRLRANESHEFQQMEQKEYTIYSFALEEQQEQYGIWANGVLVETTSRKNLEVSNMEKVKKLVKGKNQ